MELNVNYYAILNLEPKSDLFNKVDRKKVISKLTKKDFKKSYRDLSKKHHPDKGGDEVVFSKIAEAYNVLINSKEEYDEKSKYGINYDETEELYNFEFSNNNTETEVYTDRYNNFKDNEMLDIIVNIEEYTDNVVYNRRTMCNRCDGTGFDTMTENSQFDCDTCDTTGEYMGKTCFACNGKGYISPYKCDRCDGKKYIEKKVSVDLDYSKFENGLCKIEYAGNHSHLESGKVGNLYIKILSEYKNKKD